VPTCCKELADRSGAAARERADRTASSRMRKPHVRSTTIAFPAQCALASLHSAAASADDAVANRYAVAVSDSRNMLEPADEARYHFIDSAVMPAYVHRQRCQEGVVLPPALRPALTGWLDQRGYSAWVIAE
jgi:hypothetical protein